MKYQFQSSLTTEEIKERIKTQTKPLTWRSLSFSFFYRRSILGKVKTNRIYLYWVGGLYDHTPFPFIGKIIDKKDHRIICGSFSLPKSGWITLLLFFAFIRGVFIPLPFYGALDVFLSVCFVSLCYFVCAIPTITNKRDKEKVLAFIQENLLI